MFRKIIRHDKPIIQSLLDIDFYKFTMGQLVFHRHPTTNVQYLFRNRTKGVNLLSYIDLGQLREELDHVQTLRVNKSELHYLRGTNEYGDRMFEESYLGFLEHLRLPDYFLANQDGGLMLGCEGLWADTIYWETIMLAIVNELYTRGVMKAYSRFDVEAVVALGIRNLWTKLHELLSKAKASLSEFGTRRRFLRLWQEYVVRVMRDTLPAELFRGTSNTYLAMKYGLLPMGTNAHELGMVYSGIYHDEDELDPLLSQRRVLEDWEGEYGLGLSIALTDTYGSDFFFRKVMSPEQAKRWKGTRHDSGDPFLYGEKVIDYYGSLDINPKDKMIVFSDGLGVDKIIGLHHQFENRIQTTFGWGTDLTNDLGIQPLSLVIKAVRANGHGLVKLSDNIEKAIGRPEDIERMKRLTGYDVLYSEPCKY